MRHHIHWLLTSACCGALLHQPARAQTPDEVTGPQIEEIVVTAQKRTQKLQDVPLAVTAFTGDTLKARGITNVGELTLSTPGLQIQPGGGGSVIPFLRGVGSTAAAVGNESSVAVYLDGVYYTRLPPGFLTLNNIDRVEVLKGPQGTLFGRNSSGGVVNIVTPDPSQTFKAQGSIGYSRFKTIHGDAYVTGPLGENLSMDLSVGGTRQGDGWGRNLATGNRVGFVDDYTIRSKLLFEPGNATKLLLSGFYSYSNSGSQGNTFPGFTRGTRTIPGLITLPLDDFQDHNSDIDGRLRAKFWGVSLRAEQDLGFARLTSISAYTHDSERSKGDGDYGPVADFIYYQKAKLKQFTQELQLAANAGSRLNWILGLFYYDTKTAYPNDFSGLLFDATIFPGAHLYLENFQHVKSYAAYGQATYEIAPGLSLTGGLRYTRDKLSGNGIQNLATQNVVLNPGTPLIPVGTAADRKTFEKVTFRAAIDYKFTPGILGYVSFSRGYKSAGYNLIPFSAPPQRPETLDAYEAGFKMDLFERRVRLNSAAFYYKVRDPQVQLLQNGSLALSNADGSRVYGLELDGQAAVTEALTMRASFTWLDSKYTSYGSIVGGVCVRCAPSGPPSPTGGAVSPLRDIVANGNRTPLAAKATFNVGADYGFDVGSGRVTLSADYYHNSGYYFEPDNLLHQPHYDLVNAQLKFAPNDHLAVRLWGKNLLDKEYVALALTQEGGPGYPYLAGAPLSYGVSVDFRF
ncbi:TonB-dependent receptor [Rhizorhabdus dicambivorans]|uniref:TonB-dependent receptor n=1 Tax=Rhizorhabdus dicambivorans TaxID=1850238 RepID=A0A2A4FX12_9SPHN|nr:TonB-dependent receptor [Rhizorhabdus dicambivorans]ATE65875.1 TonB-dependent receptor [Rhizorhabdus dicambivorans]PCE42989.1 TonB-dependent receptor [Rhizorhabdus dicambivorans]